MIRRPPRSTLSSSSAASDVYKRQVSTQSTGKPNTTNMTKLTNNTTTTKDTPDAKDCITIKVRRCQDLRRFELNPADSATLVPHVRSLWADLDASTRLTYRDDEGDHVTMASQADVDEAFETLKLTGQQTLRLRVSDPNQPEFGRCFGKGKGLGGKGKGKGKGKGHAGKGKGKCHRHRHEEHEEHEEHDHCAPPSYHGRHHDHHHHHGHPYGHPGKGHGGKGRGKGKFLAAAAGMPEAEAQELIQKARSGDEEARNKLHEIRKQFKHGKHFRRHRMGCLGAAFARMNTDSDSSTDSSSSSSSSESD
eukprot:TRINITY_DN648_c0_g1_i6.p1 TRINITY_DN648_c0_g1~~TRINITY_DN648_c0_g1_i6.p1  ORF type:complete len:306 (-),score=72.73 TRINITY_DN648_c0_g1_i6:234-1151(-)